MPPFIKHYVQVCCIKVDLVFQPAANLWAGVRSLALLPRWPLPFPFFMLTSWRSLSRLLVSPWGTPITRPHLFPSRLRKPRISLMKSEALQPPPFLSFLWFALSVVCPKLEKFRKYIDVGGAEKYEYPKDLLEPLKSQDSALLAEMIGNGLTGQKNIVLLKGRSLRLLSALTTILCCRDIYRPFCNNAGSVWRTFQTFCDRPRGKGTDGRRLDSREQTCRESAATQPKLYKVAPGSEWHG